MQTLEQVLADARGEAAVLRRAGHPTQAQTIDRLCDAVAESARDYLDWLSESEAQLRSSHTTDWLRARFARWESQGLAKWDGRRRMYRALVIPQRANIEAARAAARRALGGAA